MKRGGRWTYTVVCVMMAIGRFEMVDWNGKLEAVHTDGTVMAVEVAANTHDPDDRQPIEVWPAPSDLAFWFALDGSHPNEPWRIRNVAPATSPTPDERAVAPELVSRLVAVVKQQVEHHKDVTNPGPSLVEARAIVAALEPVDPELLEARQVVADLYEGQGVAHLREQALSGEGDEWFHTKVALAALRRGRALASRDASRDVTPCTREQFEEDCRA